MTETETLNLNLNLAELLDWENWTADMPHPADEIRYCDTHDFPVDAHGKCKGCYEDDDDMRRTNADIDHLWNTR